MLIKCYIIGQNKNLNKKIMAEEIQKDSKYIFVLGKDTAANRYLLDYLKNRSKNDKQTSFSENLSDGTPEILSEIYKSIVENITEINYQFLIMPEVSKAELLKKINEKMVQKYSAINDIPNLVLFSDHLK